MHTVSHLPAIDPSASETGCCALIDPAAWDDLEIVFKHKPFAVATTHSVLHMPIDMNAAMTKAQQQIELAGAESGEYLMLSQELSSWKAEHHIAVAKDVPGMRMEHLSGRFVTKVFEGPFKDAASWQEQLVAHAEAAGSSPTATYFFYTACPKCSKHYGKNYVVGFARV
jgi:hypothetical protein